MSMTYVGNRHRIPRWRNWGMAMNSGYSTVTLPQNLIVSQLLVEDFEVVGEWVATSGSVAANAIEFKTGTKSIKLTSALGGNCVVTKNSNYNLSGRTSAWIWFYLHDPVANLNTSAVYLSTTNDFSKFFVLTIPPANYQVGWNVFEISLDKMTNVGAASWNDPILKTRFQIQATAGNVVNISIDAFYAAETMPAVLLMFDDGDISQYNIAYSYCKPRNFMATDFVISGTVGTPGVMTESQLKIMYAGGWDLGNHTNSATDLTTLTQIQAAAAMDACENYLNGIGATRASNMLAFPSGARNATVFAAMVDAGMVTGRTVSNFDILLPSAKLNDLPARNLANTVSLATAKGYIDTAIANKKICPILLHYLVETPVLPTHWAISDFTALIDYIIQQGIVPIRMSDLYALTTSDISVTIPISS